MMNIKENEKLGSFINLLGTMPRDPRFKYVAKPTATATSLK